MPVITRTNIAGGGRKTITQTTLTASDTFTYGTGDILLLRNPTAGALSPVIDGDAGTTVPVPGGEPLNVAPGLALGSIAAGEMILLELDTRSAYLQGTITVTGGAGLVAAILTK